MIFDFDQWENLPALNDRIATHEDFAAGIAIFYQEGPCEPANERALPALAKWRSDSGELLDAVVVQMERQIKEDGAIICGLYLRNGQKVVCTAGELDFVSGVV